MNHFYPTDFSFQNLNKLNNSSFLRLCLTNQCIYRKEKKREKEKKIIQLFDRKTYSLIFLNL